MYATCQLEEHCEVNLGKTALDWFEIISGIVYYFCDLWLSNKPNINYRFFAVSDAKGNQMTHSCLVLAISY